MLNRDFNKSVKSYINQNKIWLIVLASILIVGLIVGLIFGMNTNYEISGYNEFSITITAEDRKDFDSISNKIHSQVNKYDGDCDTISLFGEGDNSKVIVRYMSHVSAEDVSLMNNSIAQELNISIDLISDHVEVSPEVKASDYIYTATAILLLLVIVSIFAYFRYNGASAISIISASVIGTCGYIALSTILRLTVGMSYFAMLILLNVVIMYFAIDMFERMRSTSWLGTGDYANCMKDAMKHSRFRMCVVSTAILLMGVLFVMVAPTALKYISLNIMFLAVVLLAVVWYIIPFVWNILIPHCKKAYKVKSTETTQENKD